MKCLHQHLAHSKHSTHSTYYYYYLLFDLEDHRCLMKWMSLNIAHHFLGSCSLVPPGKTAGKWHLRLNPMLRPGLRRLPETILRRVWLNLELFLIELAGPFQRLMYPTRMSPRCGPGGTSRDQEDEACCLHYSLWRRIWIHKMRSTTHGSLLSWDSVPECPSHVASLGQLETS